MESRAKLFGHPIHQMLVLLYAASWLSRSDLPQQPGTVGYLLAFAGGGLALFTGWMGGELVDRLSVGEDDGAHVNAPSSLTARRVRA